MQPCHCLLQGLKKQDVFLPSAAFRHGLISEQPPKRKTPKTSSKLIQWMTASCDKKKKSLNTLKVTRVNMYKARSKKHEVNVWRQITSVPSNTQFNTNVKGNSQKKKDAHISYLSALLTSANKAMIGQKLLYKAMFQVGFSFHVSK